MGQPRYDKTRNQYVYGDSPSSDAANLVDGAITHADGVHALTKATTGVFTLTPPTAGEEGMRMVIVSRTAPAVQGHGLTITEGLGGKGAGFTVITFVAVGDSIELLADNLHWVPVGAPYGCAIT